MITEIQKGETYRKQSIEMIQNIKRPDILQYIYTIVKDIAQEDE